MKYYLLIALFLVGFRVSAQLSNLPTVAEVFDYNIGDTLIYKTTTGPELHRQTLQVVIEKTSVNNVLTYKYERWYKQRYETPWYTYIYVHDTIEQTYYNAGDTLNISLVCYTDNSGAYQQSPQPTADTIFGLAAFFFDSTCSISCRDIKYYTIGIGLVRYTHYCYVSDFISGYDEDLVYIRKTDGYTWGSQEANWYVGVEDLFDNTASVQVFPNPFSNKLNIKATDESNNGTFIVYNTLGQQLKAVSINVATTSIDLSELDAGIYYWHYTNSKQQYASGKIIAE